MTRLRWTMCIMVVMFSAAPVVAKTKGRGAAPARAALTERQLENAQILYTTICQRLGKCRPELQIARGDCTRSVRPGDSFLQTLSPRALDADDEALRKCVRAIRGTSCADFLGHEPPPGCEIF